MPPTAKRFAFLLATALLSAPSARALIIYGTGPTDVNNDFNKITPGTNPTGTPPNGAPWANVVKFGANNASGVYLGHGYLLTANHAGMVSSVEINGVTYAVDTTIFPPTNSLQITDSNYVDLKLVKIVGLPPGPHVVQHLPLNFSTGDLNLDCTIIGWGVGKGAAITNKGWNWANDTTRALRWGTNKTLSAAAAANYSGYTYEALEASFNRSLGANAAEIVAGDSGGGLFQQFGGAWKLSGLNTIVSVQRQASASLYDAFAPYYSSPPVSPQSADSPDVAQFVRIAKYAHLLRYENWAFAKLGDATAPATADNDKDSSSNLLEYAFQSDPNTASTAALPHIGIEPGFLTLTYTKFISATDLNYVVEFTDSLSPANWQPATVTEEVVSSVGYTVVIKAKVALASETQKFLRLSVTKLE